MKLAALGDRDPAHLTHREIDATLALLSAEIDCGWVSTDSAQARELDAVDAVWLLPGTPYREDDAPVRRFATAWTPARRFSAPAGDFSTRASS
jgi:hypothetical protein